jgi:methylase of polypeptide subunit release factors
MEITVSKDELYSMIKSAIKEVISETKFDYIFTNIPYVSDEEMKDIESVYGIPNHNQDIIYSETIDL